ncbi:YIP1 family protein [Clostridium thermarum]|uniref:YIP1 family protein n=1 Tax=Clostridium thermarum TaxID=1716543 RepID=UPI0013D7828F|nr:YIP1 family protein [Clostridium thermarum]
MKNNVNKDVPPQETKRAVLEKIKLLFINPAEFFRSYDDKSWVRTLTLVGIITMVLTFIEHFFINQPLEIEQEYANAGIVATPTLSGAIIVTLVLILTAFTIIFINTIQYYILIRILGSNIKFAMITAVYSTAFAVTMVGDSIVSFIKMIPVNWPEFNLDPYLSAVLDQLNLFNLFSLVLMFFGIKVFSKLSNKRIILVVVLMVISKVLYNFGLISLSQAIG